MLGVSDLGPDPAGVGSAELYPLVTLLRCCCRTVHILKQFRPHSNYDQAFCRVGAANFIFFLKLELISAAKKLFIERSSCLDFYVFIAAVDTNEEQTDTSVFDSFFSRKNI